jgi:hypothetical protein
MVQALWFKSSLPLQHRSRAVERMEVEVSADLLVILFAHLSHFVLLHSGG